MPPVERHAADRLGHPGRVAAEQLVISRSPQETDDPQLHDEVVDELLNLLFRIFPARQVALGVTVEKSRDAADRHRRAVLLLDRGQIAEVEPLDRLFRILRRARDIEAVFGGHRLELAERLDLLGDLLALADHIRIHHVGDRLALRLLLRFDQEIDAVERHAAVVADDPAAPVVVRQPGDDAGVAHLLHLVGVDVEHAVVVGLAVFENMFDGRVHLPPVSFELGVDEPEAAERHDRPLQRSIGLKPDDRLKLPVDVAGLVRGDGRNGLLVDVVNAVALAFQLHALRQNTPQFERPLRRRRKEIPVAVVRSVVVLNKISDIDFGSPCAVLEIHEEIRLSQKNDNGYRI